jgi:hypothetical protein
MHGSVGASGSTFEPHSHCHFPLIARPPARSVSAALIFMFGFHGALAVTAILNWKVPCDQPLQWFLLLFGLAGLAGSLAYFVLEVVLNREQLPGVPDKRKGGRTPKLVVATLLALAFGIGLMGTILLATGAQTSTCAVTAPIVHKWAYAAALAFCIFGSLLLFVPLIAVLLPFLALALMPLIACLATCAQWMDAAGRRGPFGAVGSLQRLLRLAPEEEAPLLGTNSNFALYVNTTALCWFFTYLLVEVRRNWLLACDAPLHVFVGAVAVLGLGLSVLDFMHDVFKDPMPPLTKAEQSSAKGWRKSRLAALAWLLGAILFWGALGLLWLQGSTTCAHTAPAIYRLALLLSVAFVVLVVLLLVILLLLMIDFCCSGRLHLYIVFDK